jgi:hypothetical protein
MLRGKVVLGMLLGLSVFGIPPSDAGAIAPAVDKVATTASEDRAVLRARVGPQGLPTDYHFEYGLTASYGATTSAGDAGSGAEWILVRQAVTGLIPGMSYHYRVVAVNSDGVTFGEDRVVHIGGGLPDARRYEQVSPVDKNGNDVTPDSGRTRTAADGSAVQFSSLTGGFGDVRGTAFSGEYVSQRTSRGWVTHGITPLLNRASAIEISTGAGDTYYFGEFSDDLSSGVTLSNRLLTSDGANVATMKNLYLRQDLRTPGAGSYTLLTDADNPLTAPVSYRPFYAGASDDFTHILFSARANLTTDAPAQPINCNAAPFFQLAPCNHRLYEWVAGVGLRLVGILPDDECEAAGQLPGCPAVRSIAGQGTFATTYTPHTISQDGSRIFFTVGAGNGSTGGRLYVRENATTTLRINVSERTDCAEDPTCGGDEDPDPAPDVEQEATYQDASVDGSIVYFTTMEQLTDNDANLASDLYRWNRDAPVGGRLTRISVDQEPSDSDNAIIGVLGVSGDGEYVYFAGASQLVAGAPPQSDDDGLVFVWHAGQVRFIGNVEVGDALDMVADDGWALRMKTARVTPDGTHLVFVSRAQMNLTGYASGTCAGEGCREVYVYSYAGNGGDGALACVSCMPDGPPSAAPSAINARQEAGFSASGPVLTRAITADGRRVFFHTGNPLVPQDQNGTVSDVYMYDVQEGSVSLISSGRGEAGSYFLGASASGDDLFFVTRDRLVRSDVDDNFDMYDARVGGGFPDPEVKPICHGDRCQGPLSSVPNSPSLGSSSVRGGDSSGHAHVFSVQRLSAHQMRRLAAGLTARLLVRVSDPGRVRARIRARVGGRARTVASTSKRARAGGAVRLAVRLSPRALSQLRLHGTLRIVVAVGYSPVSEVQRMALTLRVPGEDGGR